MKSNKILFNNNKGTTKRINGFFIQYNRCLENTKLYFDTPIFKGLLPILEDIYNAHLIVGYKLICYKNVYGYRVYPKYGCLPQQKLIKKFKFVSRPGNRIFMSLQNLLKWKEWGMKTSLGFLRTRFGFVSHKTALTLKTGGELIVIIT